MTLKEWREAAHKFTEKLSDFNRQLAFAGIAIIWIFKIQMASRFMLPNDLLLPLLFIIIALGLDLLHYLYCSIAWTCFHRRKEQKIKQGILQRDADIKAPKWISNIAYGLFFGKVVSNIIGFIFLFIYISKELF